jgi:multifunctional methyltransferase subunit TRM112
MLQCVDSKCTTNNYPLELKSSKIEMKEAEKNPEFIRCLLSRLDWPALKRSVDSLNLELPSIPEEMTEEILKDDAMIDILHKLLMEVGILK